VFFYDRETRFPGVAAILPCGGAALIIWANGHTLTSAGKLLAARPIVFIGLISYSLYLWHWPLLVFSRYWTLDQITISQRELLLLVSGVLAVLSWRFVETPFRKRIVLKRRSQIFTFAGITIAMLLLAGLAINELQGVPSRIPAEALRDANGRTDRALMKELGLKEALNGDFMELGTGDKHLPIDLLVWGDSHAMAVTPVFDILCKEHSVRGVAATHSSTAPLIGYESQARFALKEDSIAFNNAVVEFIRCKHVRDVVLVAVWSDYMANRETARLRRHLLDTIDALRNSGARIWIMKDVPRQRWNVPLALASAVWHGGDPEQLGLPLAEHARASRLQDRILVGISAPGVTLLDPTDLFMSPKNLCRVAEGGKSLYCDKHHLSVAGAMVLRPLFEPIFRGINKSLPIRVGSSVGLGMPLSGP